MTVPTSLTIISFQFNLWNFEMPLLIYFGRIEYFLLFIEIWLVPAFFYGFATISWTVYSLLLKAYTEDAIINIYQTSFT